MFVTDMRSWIHSTTPPDQHVCEAIICFAFCDPNASFTNFSAGKVFHA
jgi:hypothetical protein